MISNTVTKPLNNKNFLANLHSSIFISAKLQRKQPVGEWMSEMWYIIQWNVIQPQKEQGDDTRYAVLRPWELGAQ